MTHRAIDIEALANDYFAEVIRGQEIEMDAFDRLVDLTSTDPAAAWIVVQRLIELSTSDVDLAHVGAGPLEQLLVDSPERHVPVVVEESKRDPRLRRALEFVVIADDDIPAEQWRALDAAQQAASGANKGKA
jgi:hypothetical protein